MALARHGVCIMADVVTIRMLPCHVGVNPLHNLDSL